MMGCVYTVFCRVSKKFYVGKTIDTLKKRKYYHHRVALKGCGYLFHRALIKYGFKNFEWRILHYSDDNEKLCEVEKGLIADLYCKAPYGYNLTNGGEGFVGIVWSEERRKQLSIIKTGTKHKQQAKDKLSKFFKGRVSPNKGRKFSEEHKRKISAAMLGKLKDKFTEEHRHNISKARRKSKRVNGY